MIGLLYVSAIKCIFVRTSLPNSYKMNKVLQYLIIPLQSYYCIKGFNIESPVQRNDLLGK